MAKARVSEKMIELKIKFWTNDLVESGIEPGHAWSSGTVNMKTNNSHGIKAENPVPFNSVMDLPAAIEKVLI